MKSKAYRHCPVSFFIRIRVQKRRIKTEIYKDRHKEGIIVRKFNSKAIHYDKI
ncbi:hypothetical protein NRS6131_20110 [Bacillus subtilis]|nr:hypothetical protein NRS6131_02106 [Bacillus subtilis]CAI6328119.1 hypothetical protein NRS6131_20110 [Bacillus subtilis]